MWKVGKQFPILIASGPVHNSELHINSYNVLSNLHKLFFQYKTVYKMTTIYNDENNIMMIILGKFNVE